MMPVKRVAVIGAGAAGLVAVKCCLEVGLEVTCYEKSAHVGGLWHFVEKPTDTNAANVYKSTLTNVSKLFLCFSDFPQPEEWPNFLPHYLVSEYLERYAAHFGLCEHVRLEHEVLSVNKAQEPGKTLRKDPGKTGKSHDEGETSGKVSGKTTGKDQGKRTGKSQIPEKTTEKAQTQSAAWVVSTRDLTTGEEQTEYFDAVMVCAGLHRDPVILKFPGLADFQGQVVHTVAYKDAAVFKDKKVLVVGFGENAVDAAIEISRINKKVYVSTRNGNWVIPRAAPDGMPYEQILYNRSTKFWQNFDMFNSINNRMESICSQHIDHDVYNIKPPWRFTQGQALISEDLPNRVIGGYIELKSGIERITPNGAVFTDGSELHDIDTIIMGTGFNCTYPFIDSTITLKKDGKFDLYKWIFPPGVEPASMAVIGGVRVLGSHFATFELQARFAARVFQGLIYLPDAETMRQMIKSQHQHQQEIFLGNPRHHVTTNWLQYNDELAAIIGCKPSMLWLLLRDPWLAKVVWYQPCVPAQYRLMGPGAWKGARDVIIATHNARLKPLTTRNITHLPNFQKPN